MMKQTVPTVFFALTLLISSSFALADDQPSDKPKTKLTAATFGGFKLRAIGPALMSGRISDVAIDPVKPNTWYVAAGSGNLWKTTNAGTTWTPIFDSYSSYSIGCVTIDPSNRHTIWVGSGEDVGGRHVGYGDGVYKSLDGGKTFKNVGLKYSEHITDILVDPRDSNVVFVAAQGPLWSPGGERGLYKSTDGGKTWKQILAKGPYTGISAIAFDPRNPDVIYAATHQRHRTVWSLINGGPETGIFKSTDGGKNWRELKDGLPAQDKGKIGLAVSPIKPDVVYATIELAGRTGGFWRSPDGGATWSKMSDYISGGTGPHYYQEIFADPHRFDVVYQVNVRMGRTEDGGKTWQTVESPWKHVDNHAVGFHPSDADFLLVGCDGGLYRSYDYGKTFAYCANLPLTQFYKLSLDNDRPFYNIVGGTQDNNTQYGPSRTNNRSGIRNSDWLTTIGGDGHDCAIDPQDPNIIYCESQQGFLRRYDRRTGESIDIRPQPEHGEETLRFNWDSPIHISPHSHTRLYFGSKKLHRSDDRGDSWTAISPDLSRNRDRFKLKVMDRVWSIDSVYDLSAMSQFGNITSISESPLKEGLIYVGTDDGLIQVTEDGGKHWRKIERIYSIPEFSFVNDIKADLHDVNTVYAVFDNHKTGDFTPYIMKSTDCGRKWTSIVGDLPDRHIVWRFVQDHVNRDLYFIGTEFGLFFTLDGGKKWIKLTGNVPTIPFRDIEIQKRENDLVGATFGRGFYVLDDYSPLRKVSDKLLTDSEFVLFPIKKARLYVPARVLGREKGSQGDAFFTAPNPPFGAVFTYYLRDTLKTRKQVRHEKEAKVKKSGGDNIYAGWNALKKEEREEGPVITFTITDPDGNVVNRVDGPTSAGFHRVAWNLRHAPFTAGSGSGPLATPGKYKVSAAKRVDDAVTPLGKPRTFKVVAIGKASLAAQDRQAVLRFQTKVGELQRAVTGANGKVQETLDQLAQIKKAVKQTPKAGVSLFDESRALELKLMDVRDSLTGDATRTRRRQTAPPSIIRRIQNALAGTLNNTYGPTKTHRREYAIGRAEYEDVVGTLTTLIEVDFTKLKKKLDKAGVPWTAGRRIPELAKLAPTHADVSYGPHARNVLDFWKAEGDGPRPLLVYIHGGGWTGGDKKQDVSRFRPYLEKGISYAAINYRLTGEAPLPAPVHDAARAIQFIRSKAAEWNIKKTRIALTGSSAGACTSMWILLHDDLADPKSDDPVLRESTRVYAAAVSAGQTSIDPKVIEPWLGPNVLKHRMIWMAVGEKTIEDALKNYEKHKKLYIEFSPYNHLSKDDPPLFMSYGNNMKLPSENAGHGIHHPVYGVKMKEKADRLKHECHLLIKGVSKSEKYASATEFLMSKLLVP